MTLEPLQPDAGTPAPEKASNDSEKVGSDQETPNEGKSPSYGSANLDQYQAMYGENYGTSGYKIIKAKPQLAMPNQLTLDTWLRNCKNPEISVSDRIKQGTELLKSDFANFNTLQNLFGYQGAEWTIHLGNTLIHLKDVVREAGHIWGVWSAKNLSFIGDRTREKMMRLARRKDCWKYTILGTERLDVLLTAIPQSHDVADPIGAFLARHNIRFDPATEFNLEEFKRQIDHALNSERLSKQGLSISADKVAALVDNGREVDGALIKELKAIQRSGGTPESHIDHLIMSGGRESSEVSPEKRLQDVNSLASRLIKSLDFVLAKKDLVDLVDKDIYLKLVEKLQDLNKLRNMTVDKAEAAA